MMHLGRIWAIMVRQLYLMRGNLVRVVPLFAWVAIDMLLWGFMSRYLNSVTSSRLSFVPMLLGAVLLWDFFGRVMQGVTTAFLEDVWTRNFLNLFATPLSITEYLCGMVATGMLTSLVGLTAMLLIASGAFGLSFVAYGLTVIPCVLVLVLFGVALGILGSALVLRLGPAAEWFVWPIPALLSPFVGVFYPLSVLPGWMRGVAYLLPPSYVFESLRGMIGGGPAGVAGLVWSGGLAVLDVTVACWGFTRIYRHAVRTGLIARYSAETVS